MNNTTQAKQDFDPKEFYRDEPLTGTKPEDLLASARLTLLMNFPFFGKIAQGMSLHETDMVPTTAVDAKGRLYYNPKWVNHMTLEDAVFEFAHETGHLYQRVFDTKPEGANHGLYNKAADWRVDTDLVDAGFKQSKISAKAVDAKAQEKTRELGTTPAIYRWMLKEAESNTDCPACKQTLKNLQQQSSKIKQQTQQENKEINEGSPSDGDGDQPGDGKESGHSHGQGDGSCESDSGGGGELKHTCGNVRQCCVGSTADLANASPEEIQTWTEKIIGAKMFAEGKGNMPGHIGARIDELTKSTVRWQDLLRTRSNKAFGRERYSFRKRNKRHRNVRLPRAMPESKTAIIAMDTSGSMSKESVVQSITESAAIMKACGADKIYLILHDAVPYYSGYVTDADLTKLQISQGGTSHIGVFECINRTYANDEMNLPLTEEVELAILFSDLGTCFPDLHPSYDTIWGVPAGSCPGMSQDVPFGIKVEVPMA
jgi:predicted metal-dependent peptidase